MKYIKQTGSNPITIVIDNDNLLENHPSIKNNPDLFEIIDLDELPKDVQFLEYEI